MKQTLTQRDPDPEEYYGGTPDELHPERDEVINSALERYEAGTDTPADRVLLWFDIALNATLVGDAGFSGD